MLLVYVSGHGFGHAVRTAAVLDHLLRLRPRQPIQVVSNAPRWIFPAAADYHSIQTDVGLVQRDGLEHDEEATLVVAGEFLASLDVRAEVEAARLRDRQVRLVLGDIPPLGFEVADRLGVPSVALGNFGWDDIYLPFVSDRPGFEALAKRAVRAYQRADLLLRLPFHLEMPAFRERLDLPLVTRQATRSRREARQLLDVPAEACLVLLAFGGFDLPGLDLAALGRLPEYLFLRPVDDPRGRVLPNVLEIPGHGLLPFPDIVAASDAVVTKPGYGMVADLFANRVPALFAERPRFAEYPVLADALQRFGRALPIPRADLEAGRLGSYLERLLALETPWADLPLDGAPRAAALLAAALLAERLD